MADKTVETRAREAETAGRGSVLTKMVDIGDDVYAPGVTIVGLDTPVELTGSVSVDTWGALDDAKETDPDAASATIPALVRGLLNTELLYAERLADSISTSSPSAALKVVLLDDNANHVIGGVNESATTDPTDSFATVTSLLRGILAALGAAGDAADDPTVIGQLKQIVINTTPSP